MDENQNWINGTPARVFYMDEVVLDANPDQREMISGIGHQPWSQPEMTVYSVEKTIFFSMPDATQAQVYDLSGKGVISRNLTGGPELNAISVPETGIYILRVATRSGKVSAVKIYVK
jgi:hypothetical protein